MEQSGLSDQNSDYCFACWESSGLSKKLGMRRNLIAAEDW